MLFLSRFLPKRWLRVLLAARTTRQQARQSDDLGAVAALVAFVVALWTLRSETAKRDAEEQHSTLREALGG